MTVQQLAIVVAAAIPLLAVSALAAAADRRLSRKKKKVKGLLSSSSRRTQDDGGAGCSPCENCEKSIKPWRQLVKRRRKKEGDFHVLPQQLLKDGCSE